MLEKIIRLIFAFAALTAVALPVQAQEQTVFGPSDFEIGAWHIHLSRQTFDVDVPGDGYIEITKNTPDEDINGGVVFFNWRLIPLRQFLTGDDLVFYKDVKLKANNRLTVFLRGTPGASVKIEIKSTDSPVPPPEIVFSADPLSIFTGESSTLSWEVSNADLVNIDNDIGNVSPIGSMVVTPLETTTYTIVAMGPGGSASDTVTVTVTPTPSTVEISAEPETIERGQSTTLYWTSTDAESCVIEPDIDEVDVSGSVTVAPTETTTYTIVAQGPGGEATDIVTVTVIDPPPTVDITADPGSIELGETATLSWSSANADTCVIDPDIGSVDPSGSIEVSPSESTTYTITATGLGGTATATVTVTVYQPPSVSISASPDTILLGGSATLTWNSSYAGSASIDQGIGSVPVDGSITVSPTENTTYTITVLGSGGMSSDSVTVTVTHPIPTLTFSADPEVVILGESATLTWTSEDAESCTISPGIGPVDPNGSIQVSPSETTTYVISAVNAGNTATASVTVTVTHPPFISLLEPDGTHDTADINFTISWTDDDPDSNASISLYYDTDNTGANGTLIVQGLSEDPDGEADDSFIWQTAEVPEGSYYVYAVIDDSVHGPVITYSQGPMTVVHEVQPEIKLMPHDLSEGDNFGHAVSLSGDYAVVGTPFDDDKGESSGAAYIFKREGVVWVEQAKLIPADGAANDNFGHAVSLSGDYVVVGAYGHDDGGESAGAAYIYKREGETWTDQAKLTSDTPSPEDYFGWSVSLSGDYAVIGAYGDDEGGDSAGAAYVFMREGETWIQDVKLIAGDPAPGDYFGWSVAVDGDSTIIGAHGEDDAGGDSGAAYAFKKENSVWIQQNKLTADDAEAGDHFGCSVDICGNHSVIGAWGDDDEGEDAGAAYIFRRASPWSQVSKLKPEPGDYSNFGTKVTIRQINGRLYCAISLYSFISGAGPAGKIYLFQEADGSWPVYGTILPNNGDREDTFGNTVSMGDDAIIVGSPGNDTGGDDAGAAYVYPISTVNIQASPENIQEGETTTLSWNTTNAKDITISQGIGPVAESGSMVVSPQATTTYIITGIGPNGPVSGNVTVIVSPPLSIDLIEPDGMGDAADSSFIIRWTDTDPDHTATISLYYDNDDSGEDGSLICEGLSADPDGSGDEYMWDISLVPDGVYYVYGVISAGEDKPVVSYGPGPLFVAHMTSETDNALVTASDAGPYNHFGWAVALSGDDAIISAAGGPYGGGFDGAVYAYSRMGDIWVEQAKLTAGDVIPMQQFGYAVSMSGDYAIVGTQFWDYPEGVSHYGSAYTFERNSGTWDAPVKLTASDAVEFDDFGRAVSISGDYAIVGAPGGIQGEERCGAAYVFTRSGGIWTQQAKLTAADAADADEFGWAVSMSADYAVVGAKSNNDSGYSAYSSSGSVYVFKREGSIWSLQTKLTAPDGNAGDQFGYSVSLDGNQAVIGTKASSDSLNCGAAYVFSLDGETWTYQTKMFSEKIPGFSGSANATAVSVYGDSVVISATGSEAWPPTSGAAVIYKYANDTWKKHLTFYPKSIQEEDAFGISAGMGADYALVGAGFKNDGGIQAGAAYFVPHNVNFAYDADQDVIVVGDCVTLTWNYDNATQVYLDNGIGVVPASGSMTLYPEHTTTYTIIAKGPWGMSTQSIPIQVVESPPTVMVTASPQVICNGESAIISWVSTDAVSVDISPGPGSVDLEGSMTVAPTETTVYTVTATGLLGTVSEEVTVTLNCPPGIYVQEPNGDNDIGDSSYVIKWNDTDQDDNAVISLYYDRDRSGQDGTLIVSGLSEDADDSGDEYVWDTSAIPEGRYYVYAVIDDGLNEPVSDYSNGMVIVDHYPDYFSETKLTADDAASGDNFGLSVAVHGDYAIVGAPFDEDAGSSSGAAYIFKREGGAWVQQAKLTAEDAAFRDCFGSSVAIEGEYAVVGAPGKYYSFGAVYVFKREGSTWTQKVKLEASDATEYFYFGCSVDVSNGNIIAGAAKYPSEWGRRPGSAYIFRRFGDTWVEEANLTTAPDILYFGHSVSMNGDYAVVGANNVDYGPGVAYVFKREPEAWLAQAVLSADAPEWNDGFGYSVSMSGDYIIIGADTEDKGGRDTGASYVFERKGTSWVSRARLVPEDPMEHDMFGHDVAIDGDYAIIGAYNNRFLDNVSPANGAWVFKNEDGAWTQYDRITSSDMAEFDQFGCAVAINSGYAIVGAFEDEDLAYRAGAAYIFRIGPHHFSAEADMVLSGDSTILSWDFSDATSVTIDNGIGTVPISGSVVVSPTGTTTYTITAEGPWGTYSESVTVTVIYPPTLSITADPTAFALGETSVLTWATTHVEKVTIDPGVGDVALSGSITLSPIETTVYTVTAMGPGGVASDTVTLTVYQPPTVTLSADSETILLGESCNLSWETTLAESVTIDHGIGPVGLSGSMVVTPTETIQYTISATGPGGTATAHVIINVELLSPIITSPSMGEIILRPDIMVEGTFNNPNGSEVGITVNGIPALVYGNSFVANHVRLVEGENTITVYATDTYGNTGEASVIVQAQGGDAYATITADPESGVSPLETSLSFDANFDYVDVSLTKQGPGGYEFLGECTWERCPVSVDTEGLHYFIVDMTNDQGEIFTDKVAVLVEDEASIDSAIRERWNEMKDKLIQGDIQGALEFYNPLSRHDYEMTYTALGDELPGQVAALGEIEKVYIRGDTAKYKFRREEVVDGQTYNIAYHIYFIRDIFGRWHIDVF